jgi:hypothetical protein
MITLILIVFLIIVIALYEIRYKDTHNGYPKADA